ncbi:M56 family metallopeptidase [Mucilaginibacter mali]|uniref:M56 family metallopeptidase n=1 Tax=Mucilaginibacter mali TaxID=2740462 RepID=A0A7D4UQ86_9SPHI|nr:M56 family metallopeptidase [Mucilaginibacter mali]QKJ32240.1 M56 family metallopeptidase [Mucilaginibacter mali]
MDNHFFSAYFSDQTIKAVCWTLVHSLWIGLVVAALAGLVIALTKNATANMRYNLLCALLVLFVAACGFTFLWEISDVPVQSAANGNLTVASGTGTPQGQAVAVAHGISYGNVVNVFNRFSGWIFTIWLLCFVFKAIKLCRELLYVQKVKNTGITGIAGEWQHTVNILSQKLGVRNRVTLLESELVKVPVTIGYLKPVILLPAGMLLQLPPGQIDTIILHELAHILRRDYLVNILQSVVETVFFFNPAIWWLSALIREERENCCDDIVLEQVQQKRNYLEALMAFQNFEATWGKFAIGLSLRKHSLMNRLRRMVNKENQKLNPGEKIVLLSGMILLCICTFVPKANSEIRHGAAFIKKHVAAVLHPNQPAELPEARHIVKISAPKTRLMNAPVDSIPQSFKPDTLPAITSIKFRKTNADSANKEMDILDNKGTHYYAKVENNRLIALEINGVKTAEQDLGNYQGLLQYFNDSFKRIHQKKENFKADGAAKMQDQRARDLEQMKMARAGKANNKFTKMNNDSLQAFKQANAKSKTPGPGFEKKGSYVKIADSLAWHQQKPQKHIPRGPDNSADQARVRGVITVLVQEKVVASAADVDWFGLDDEVLMVNGQKQSDALHQRLKEAYGIKPKYGLFYGPSKLTGSGIHMDKGDM